MDKIKIAIAADGKTDYQIFKFLIEKYIFTNIEEIEFTYLTRCPNGIDLLSDWWKSKKNDLNWKNNIAEKFHRALISAYQEWNEKGGEILYKHFLIYHLDSERLSKKEENIIIGWSREIIEALWRGIDLFYFRFGKINKGLYYLPKILPILLFPSTEILGAVFAGITDYRNKKPPEMKKELYGTSNLFEINENEFKDKIESIFIGDYKNFLTHMHKIPEIYRILLMFR